MPSASGAPGAAPLEAAAAAGADPGAAAGAACAGAVGAPAAGAPAAAAAAGAGPAANFSLATRSRSASTRAMRIGISGYLFISFTKLSRVSSTHSESSMPVTVAERGLLSSSDISPKNCSGPSSATCIRTPPCSRSTLTRPLAIKYKPSPISPCRTMVSFLVNCRMIQASVSFLRIFSSSPEKKSIFEIRSFIRIYRNASCP